MPKIVVITLLSWGTLLSAQTAPGDTIGAIDFFGYKGLDLAAVRVALPVHVGSTLTEQTRPAIETAVVKVTGQKPTDVAQVCCDAQGRSMIYIGLRGETFKPFALNPAPAGTAHLPTKIVELSSRADDALGEAVSKGRADEDQSRGYSLAKDPASRALQVQERTWALAHGSRVFHVLRDSADANQREVAGKLLGYVQQSHEQIAALVHASRDPDANVRNSATRALGVLVMSNPKLATAIEPDTYLAMLGSGTWTDHNKAIWLLAPLTASRDFQLLARIRDQALDQLVEMARWTNPGHAVGARLVLARLAGVPDDKLETLLANPPPDAIIEAAKKQ